MAARPLHIGCVTSSAETVHESVLFAYHHIQQGSGCAMLTWIWGAKKVHGSSENMTCARLAAAGMCSRSCSHSRACMTTNTHARMQQLAAGTVHLVWSVDTIYMPAARTAIALTFQPGDHVKCGSVH